MTRVAIRQLSRDDLAAHIRDFIEIARDVPGEYWAEEHFLKEFPEKWDLSVSAWDGERPVGYAVLSRKGATTAHLHHLMVAADKRGANLGADLLVAAIRGCLLRGCSEMTLKVAVDSEGALRFYRRHGFSDTGEDRAYRMMRRALALQTVAIHQPNYAPWLGHFAKMAASDTFVFLDDAQYSKNGYINRVQIDASGEVRWLTIPVSYSFGDPIAAVHFSNPDWRKSHLDTLRTYYRRAAHFKATWTWLSEIYAALPQHTLALSNARLIECIARRLGIAAAFCFSSAFQTDAAAGDDRLIALVRAAGGARYLSGKGGKNYQDPEKFAAAGIMLTYTEFVHPVYEQGHAQFISGLSIFDALFQIGFEATAALIHKPALSA